MRIAALLLGTFLFAAPADAAQELDIPPVRYPDLPREGAAAEDFVPAGWRIDRRAAGDLDRDGRADLALVLRMADPRNVIRHGGLGENPFDTNPRILAIAFGTAEGRYRLVLQNRRLIPRHEYPTASDPFGIDDSEFEIARGVLRLSLHRFMNAGGWDMGQTAFAFRWQDGAMRLIGYDYSNLKRNTGCLGSLSVNYLTGRAKTVLTHIGIDRERVRWRRLPARPLLTLDQVGDGLEFDAGGLLDDVPNDCDAAGLVPEDE